MNRPKRELHFTEGISECTILYVPSGEVNKQWNQLNEYCDELEKEIEKNHKFINNFLNANANLLNENKKLEKALNKACDYTFEDVSGCPTAYNFELEMFMDGICERCICDTDSISYKYKGVKCWKKFFMKEVQDERN